MKMKMMVVMVVVVAIPNSSYTIEFPPLKSKTPLNLRPLPFSYTHTPDPNHSIAIPYHPTLIIFFYSIFLIILPFPAIFTKEYKENESNSL